MGLTPNLKQCLSDLNQILGSNFNSVLVNRYNCGGDYIGAHSDDERYVDDRFGVVAISYGAVRKFRIRDKRTGAIVVDVPTTQYEIIQMGGKFQSEFTHEIPVQKKVVGERYSFTFRCHTK